MQKSLLILFLFIGVQSFSQSKMVGIDNQQIIDSLLNDCNEGALERAEACFASFKLKLCLEKKLDEYKRISSFAAISAFENNKAIALNFEQFYLIDTNYQVLQKLPYKYVSGLHNGIMKFRSNGNFGLLAANGKIELQANFFHLEAISDLFFCQSNDTLLLYSPATKSSRIISGIESFNALSPDFIEIRYKTGKSTLFDRSGKELLTPEMRSFSYLREHNTVVVYQQKEAYLISTDGRQSKRFLYLFGASNSYFSVKREDQFYLINRTTFEEQPLGTITPCYNTSNYLVTTNGGKYGIGSETGQTIIPAEYDGLRSIYKNFVTFQKSNKYHFFDLEKGTSKTYDYQSFFTLNSTIPLFLAKSGKQGLLNYKHEPILPFEYDTMIRKSNNYFFLKSLNNTIDTTMVTNVDILDILIVQHHNQIRVFSKLGQQINTFAGDKIKFNGYNINVKNQGKEGILSLDGRLLVEPIYSFVRPERLCDFYLVENNKKQGIVYKGNKEILSVKYEKITLFNGSFFMVRLDGKSGILALDGTEVLPIQYEEITPLRYEGSKYMRTKQNGMWGLVDMESGKWVLPIAYQQIHAIPSSPNCIVLKQNNVMGTVDLKGNSLIPLEYEELLFTTNHIVFRKNGKYGFMSENGTILTEPLYSQITNFRDGFAIVTLNGKKGLVDETGKVFVPIKYDDLGMVGEERYSIKAGSLWGMVDKNNKVIVAPTYDDCKYFEDGLMVFRNGLINYFIDKTGKIVKTAALEGNAFGSNNTQE